MHIFWVCRCLRSKFTIISVSFFSGLFVTQQLGSCPLQISRARYFYGAAKPMVAADDLNTFLSSNLFILYGSKYK